MNRIVLNVWIGCLAVFLAGCTRTVVGNGRGIPSPDGQFSLAVTVEGALGKAYTDRSTKTAYLWVMPGNPNQSGSIFKSQYTFVAADLSWEIHWRSASEVNVRFVDYGLGEGPYSPKRTITNQIADLTFTQVDGIFAEKK